MSKQDLSEQDLLYLKDTQHFQIHKLNLFFLLQFIILSSMELYCENYISISFQIEIGYDRGDSFPFGSENR